MEERVLLMDDACMISYNQMLKIRYAILINSIIELLQLSYYWHLASRMRINSILNIRHCDCRRYDVDIWRPTIKTPGSITSVTSSVEISYPWVAVMMLIVMSKVTTSMMSEVAASMMSEVAASMMSFGMSGLGARPSWATSFWHIVR